MAVGSCQADVHRHKAVAINERRICSQLICWYVLYYSASLDLTKEPCLQQQHAGHMYSDMLLSYHSLQQRALLAPHCARMLSNRTQV